MFYKSKGIIFVLSFLSFALVMCTGSDLTEPPPSVTPSLTPTVSTPTPSPTPTVLFPPSEGLSWAITFETTGSGYTVQKHIGPNVPGWAPDISPTLECHTYGPVVISADGIEFRKGGYIQCQDIDLNTIVSPFHELGEYIDYEGCHFDGSVSGSNCMQTKPIYLKAIIERQGDLMTEGSSERTPIFSYPQTLSGEFPGDDSEGLRFFAQSRPDQNLHFNFSVNYFLSSSAPSMIIGHEWGGLLVGSDQTAAVERDRATLNQLRFKLDNVHELVVESVIPVGENAFFEFQTEPVFFYFGDVNGEMPDGAVMYLKHLLFDRSDSCGGCSNKTQISN